MAFCIFGWVELRAILKTKLFNLHNFFFISIFCIFSRCKGTASFLSAKVCRYEIRNDSRLYQYKIMSDHRGKVGHISENGGNIAGSIYRKAPTSREDAKAEHKRFTASHVRISERVPKSNMEYEVILVD